MGFKAGLSSRIALAARRRPDGHGASFGAEDYDVLAPAGHPRGRGIGEELRRRGVRAGLVRGAPLRRQRETPAAAGLDQLGAV
jgi:hypothetical protein